MTIHDDLGDGLFRLNSGQALLNVHSAEKCDGEFCPLHNPSDHEFKYKPLVYDQDIGCFFRKLGESIEDWLIDPDDYKYSKGYEIILRNSTECLVCKTKLESRYVHEFRTCSCGNVSVDGGHDYLRRLYTFKNQHKETSIVFQKGKSI